MKSILTLATIMLVAAYSINGLSAAVVIQFQESGANVIATTSGSFQVPLSYRDGIFFGFHYGGDGYKLYLTNAPDGEYAGVWGGGSFTYSGLVVQPTSATGDTFGYDSFPTILFLPYGLTPGSSYFPSTTWTWEGHTLASIGLDYLTTTPFEVYRGYGDTISFAVVPEPSTNLMLFAGSVAAFAGLRRRQI